MIDKSPAANNVFRSATRVRAIWILLGLLVFGAPVAESQTVRALIASGAGDGNLPLSASFSEAKGVYVDPQGNVYIADTGHDRVRKISPSGAVSSIVGNGQWGYSGDGGNSSNAQVALPTAVVGDGAGNIYIADDANFRIRKIDSKGAITTFAGIGTCTNPGAGDGGPATSACLRGIRDLAVDPQGRLYLIDYGRVRRIGLDGTIEAYAGALQGGAYGDGGQATAAQLSGPSSIAIDSHGNLFIADGYKTIRKVAPNGIISTFGTANASDRGSVLKIRMDRDDALVWATYSQVYRFNTDGTKSTVLINPVGGCGYGGDGGAGTSSAAKMCSEVLGLGLGPDGSIYVAESKNAIIRKLGADGILSTYAGTGSPTFAGDGGPAAEAGINRPSGLAIDTDGAIVFGDIDNNRVRKIDAAGIISTIAGTGVRGYAGDGGPATSAMLSVNDVAIDANHDVFLSDNGGHVRKIDHLTGIITTVAGVGLGAASGDGGPATSAYLGQITSVAFDANGNMYIADEIGDRLRMVDKNGTISTVSARILPDFIGPAETGDDTVPVRAQWVDSDPVGRIYVAGWRPIRLNSDGTATMLRGWMEANGTVGVFGGYVDSIGADANGNTYSMYSNYPALLARLSSGGVARVISGDGSQIPNFAPIPLQDATFSWLTHCKFDLSGNLFLADNQVNRIYEVSPIPARIAHVPSAPAQPEATVDYGSATITFDPPGDLGSDVVPEFTVRSVPAGAVDQNAGQPVLSHRVTGLNDGITYRFYVEASNSAGTGAPSAYTNAITAQSEAVASIADAGAIEGNSGYTLLCFDIALSKPALNDHLEVSISSSAGTATPGNYNVNDYMPPFNNTLSFQEGESHKSLCLTVNGDTEVEGNETLYVSIAPYNGGIKIGRGTATGTIYNDDQVGGSVPVATGDAYSVTENQKLSVSAGSGVLHNDSGMTRASLISGAGHGGLSLGPDGSFTYSPEIGFSGTDTFTYVGCSGASVCSQATVSIAVNTLTRKYVWFMPPASNKNQQGFLRIHNRSNSSGTVYLWGVDASGHTSPGLVSFTIAPGESRQFNSQDLGYGNATAGLSGKLGDSGDVWTVVVSSTLDLETLSYIRTPDGFLTSVGDRADAADLLSWRVPIFNPASNENQVSHLRLINPNPGRLDVLVEGFSDDGAPFASIFVWVPGLSSVDLTAKDLEYGNFSKGMIGGLGTHSGKWELKVSASMPIVVQSLLYDPKGYLTSLSSIPDLEETPAGERVLWFVPRASNSAQQGFIRLLNEGAASSVAIWGVDDAGKRSTGTLTLDVGEHSAVQLNSQDIENGNPAKGVTGALGSGTGDWRLYVLADSEQLIPMALIRTPDGFLTSMHDTVAGDGSAWNVPIFNPAENLNQVSILRLVNPGNASARIVIQGVDDSGASAPGGSVQLTLATGKAVSITAQDLESGDDGLGLIGKFGDGVGKWRLKVTSTVPIKVMSLLRDPKGYLTNLSLSTLGTSDTLPQ